MVQSPVDKLLLAVCVEIHLRNTLPPTMATCLLVWNEDVGWPFKGAGHGGGANGAGSRAVEKCHSGGQPVPKQIMSFFWILWYLGYLSTFKDFLLVVNSFLTLNKYFCVCYICIHVFVFIFLKNSIP